MDAARGLAGSCAQQHSSGWQSQTARPSSNAATILRTLLFTALRSVILSGQRQNPICRPAGSSDYCTATQNILRVCPSLTIANLSYVPSCRTIALPSPHTLTLRPRRLIPKLKTRIPALRLACRTKVMASQVDRGRGKPIGPLEASSSNKSIVPDPQIPSGQTFWFHIKIRMYGCNHHPPPDLTSERFARRSDHVRDQLQHTGDSIRRQLLKRGAPHGDRAR